MSASIDTVGDFAKAFAAQRHASVSKLVGRIVWGRDPTDFATTAGIEDTIIPQFFGPLTLSRCLGRSHFEVLTRCAQLAPDFVSQQISALGLTPKLLVVAQGPAFQRANWDNVLALAAKHYPSCADILQRHLKALRGIRRSFFPNFEEDRGCAFASVKKGDPEFVDEAALVASSHQLTTVRAFLYDTLRLLESFRGDGQFADQDDDPLDILYIAERRSIGTADEMQLIELSPVLP